MEDQKQLRERHVYLVLIKHCNTEEKQKDRNTQWNPELAYYAKIIWNNEINYLRNKITKNERECGLNIFKLGYPVTIWVARLFTSNDLFTIICETMTHSNWMNTVIILNNEHFLEKNLYAWKKLFFSPQN